MVGQLTSELGLRGQTRTYLERTRLDPLDDLLRDARSDGSPRLDRVELLHARRYSILLDNLSTRRVRDG
jgi:hypothetical protein